MAKMIGLNSKREFIIIFIEGNAATALYPTIYDLQMDTDEEWKYAVSEIMDSVLDLKVGEMLHMRFNRDNQDSAGIIKRVA